MNVHYYNQFRVHVLDGPVSPVRQFGELVQKYKVEFPNDGDRLFRVLNSQILLSHRVATPGDIRIDSPVDSDDLWIQWCKLLFMLYKNVDPVHGPNENFEYLLESYIPILRVVDDDDDEMDVDPDIRMLERKKSNLREEVELLISTASVDVSLFNSGWMQRMAEEEEECNKGIELMNLRAIALNVACGSQRALMTPVCRCTQIIKLMERMLPSNCWKKWHPYSRIAWSDHEDGPVLRLFHTMYSEWVYNITTANDLAMLSIAEADIRNPPRRNSVMPPCPRHCRAGNGHHLAPIYANMDTAMSFARRLDPVPSKANLSTYVNSQLNKVVARLDGKEEYFVTAQVAAKASVLGKCYLERIRLPRHPDGEYSMLELDCMWQPEWGRITDKFLQLVLTETAFSSFERTIQLLGLANVQFYRMFPLSEVLRGFFRRLFLYIHEFEVRKMADSKSPHVTFGRREQSAIMAYSGAFRKRWGPRVACETVNTCPFTGLRSSVMHTAPRWFRVGEIPEVGEDLGTRSTVSINRGAAMLFTRMRTRIQ